MKPWIAGFLLTLAARGADVNAEKAAREIAALEGTYEVSFESGTVEGNAYTATDRLTIRKASDTAIQFHARLNFYNGHACEVEGKAEYKPDGAFVYRERFEKLECVLELVPTARSIELRDVTGGCKIITCGARGGYSHASFARSLRQPATTNAVAR